MDADRQKVADRVPGFLPEHEARALHEAACNAPPGPLLEVGTYCGKSAIWLGDAAESRATVVFTVDHHRGSEEHQPGWEYHDPDLMDPEVGAIDTLPTYRRAIAAAGLERTVIAVVGDSPTLTEHWRTPLSLVFIDGGHTQAAADADFAGWTPHLIPGGLLAIHDVFEQPEDGGQAPFHIWKRAIDSGDFDSCSTTASLRVLRRR